MRDFFTRKKFMDVIVKSQKEFEKNLKNKKLMFIYEKYDKEIGEEEIFFPTTCFYHLTGINAYDSNDKLLNSYKFYKLLQDGGIDESKLETKNEKTYYKLEVLPQLMKIDRAANMIGNFTGHSLFLQTNKLIGNVNACMGFIKNEQNIYVPNTALKIDIRDISNDRKKIIAVLKKEINDKLYKNVTYLKQKYQVIEILQNQCINKKVDIDNMYSTDKKIESKICEFLTNRKQGK